MAFSRYFNMAVSINFFALLILSSLFSSAAATTNYQLASEYSGATFFDNFDFFSDADYSGGFVTYQAQQDASTLGIISAQAGQPAFMGVDNTTILDPNGPGRASVRITTKAAFTHGLFIVDLAHMPGSICGAWPAYWMFGADWPNNGEIDIIEGVNSQNYNTISLHTNANCSMSSPQQTGYLLSTNCDEGYSSNGCSVAAAQNSNTYGTGLNNFGGGVYATEWTSSSIKIWFFPRNSIPSDIAARTPDPSSWGMPMANMAGDCDVDSHFNQQNIVFDTTFCGQWAGAVWGSDEVCSAAADTCVDFVAANPGVYGEAYWAVNYLRIYEDLAAPPTTSIASVSSVSTSSISTSSVSISSSISSSIGMSMSSSTVPPSQSSLISTSGPAIISSASTGQISSSSSVVIFTSSSTVSPSQSSSIGASSTAILSLTTTSQIPSSSSSPVSVQSSTLPTPISSSSMISTSSVPASTSSSQRGSTSSTIQPSSTSTSASSKQTTSLSSTLSSSTTMSSLKSSTVSSTSIPPTSSSKLSTSTTISSSKSSTVSSLTTSLVSSSKLSTSTSVTTSESSTTSSKSTSQSLSSSSKTSSLSTSSVLKSSTTTRPTSTQSASTQKTTSSTPSPTPTQISCPSSNGTTYTVASSSKSYLIECYNNHYAGDLKTVYVTTFAACIAACDAATGCVAFSWASSANGVNNPCYLKSSVGVSQKDTGVWGGKFVAKSTSTSLGKRGEPTEVMTSTTQVSSSQARRRSWNLEVVGMAVLVGGLGII